MFSVNTIQKGNPDAEGKHPQPGQKVRVHYVGTLLNGTEFDSSRKRGEPFEFTIGKGQVIKGWDQGVAQMIVGEKAIITCPPDYAYGAAGVGKIIPPNSTLTFQVELISFK